MLHAIKDAPMTTKWCGPSALSIITGKSYPKMLGLLEEIAGRRVKGVYTREMLKALRRQGYETSPIVIPTPLPTLAAWMRERLPEHRTKNLWRCSTYA